MNTFFIIVIAIVVVYLLSYRFLFGCFILGEALSTSPMLVPVIAASTCFYIPGIVFNILSVVSFFIFVVCFILLIMCDAQKKTHYCLWFLGIVAIVEAATFYLMPAAGFWKPLSMGICISTCILYVLLFFASKGIRLHSA